MTTLTTGSPSTTTSTSGIAAYALPYAQQNLANAWATSQQPYQAYQGQQNAAMTGLQNQSFEAAQNLGINPNTTAAGTAAGQATQNLLNTGYNPINASYQSVNAPSLNNYSMGTPMTSAAQTSAAQLGTSPYMQAAQFQGPGSVGYNNVYSQGFNNQSAAQLMNPYLQQSLNPQIALLNQQQGMQQAQNQAQATQAGAFGGSRMGVQNALQNQSNQLAMSNLVGQGYNNAFNNAQQQFNTQNAASLQAQQANQAAGINTGQFNAQMGYNTGLQNAQLQQQAGLANQSLAGQYGLQQGQFNQAANLANQSAQQQANLANQQAGLTAGQANLGAQLSTQQLGAQQNLAAQQANQQAGLTAQQANINQQQYGAGLGLSANQAAISGANAQANIGQNQYAQQTGNIGLQNTLGAQQQQYQQGLLNTQYQNYVNQLNYPYQQQGYIQNMINGYPVQNTQSITQPSIPSGIQNIASIGMGAYGISQLAKALTGADGGIMKSYKKGGMVDRYADSGLTSSITNALNQNTQQQTVNPITIQNEIIQAEQVGNTGLANQLRVELARQQQHPTGAPQAGSYGANPQTASGLTGAGNGQRGIPTPQSAPEQNTQGLPSLIDLIKMENDANKPGRKTLAQPGLMAVSDNAAYANAISASPVIDSVMPTESKKRGGITDVARYAGEEESLAQTVDTQNQNFKTDYSMAPQQGPGLQMPQAPASSIAEVPQVAKTTPSDLEQRMSALGPVPTMDYAPLHAQAKAISDAADKNFKLQTALAALGFSGRILHGNTLAQGAEHALPGISKDLAPAIEAQEKAKQVAAEMKMNLNKAEHADKLGLYKIKSDNLIAADKKEQALEKLGFETQIKLMDFALKNNKLPDALASVYADYKAGELPENKNNPTIQANYKAAKQYLKDKGGEIPALIAANTREKIAGGEQNIQQQKLNDTAWNNFQIEGGGKAYRKLLKEHDGDSTEAYKTWTQKRAGTTIAPQTAPQTAPKNTPNRIRFDASGNQIQ